MNLLLPKGFGHNQKFNITVRGTLFFALIII